MLDRLRRQGERRIDRHARVERTRVCRVKSETVWCVRKSQMGALIDHRDGDARVVPSDSPLTLRLSNYKL